MSVRRTILVVDDNGRVRRLAREVLAAEGHHVLDAGRPDEALALAAAWSGPIDLLVADLRLPAQDGAALARDLLALHPEAAVLYISAYAGGELGRKLVGHPLLPKPFAPDELVAAAEAAIAGGPGEPPPQ